MTIKQQGGVFGRNPTFNDVTVDGTLSTSGSVTSTGGLEIDGSNIVIEDGHLEVKEYAVNSSVYLRRAQGTQAAPTSIANGQTLAQVRFDGYTGSVYRTGAMIQARVSAGVSGDEIPTDLQFHTTADGANSPTHQWSINQNGNLVAVQAGNGIDFSATAGTGTSELFDDYEEGTWTPVVSDAATGGNVGSTPFAAGQYTKVGNLVTIDCQVIDINTAGMTAGNTLFIQGLPYASRDTSFTLTPMSCTVSSVSSASGNVIGCVGQNATAITMREGTTTGGNVLTVAAVTSGSGDIRVSGSYMTA